MINLLFVPACYASVLTVTYLCLNLIKTSFYFPNLIWMIIFMGGLELLTPFKKVAYKRKNLLCDFSFIFINLTLIPVIWYATFYSFYHMESKLLMSIQEIPLYLQIMLVFFISEFFRYWMHRFQHEKSPLWKFHAVHHSMKELYAYNQFISHPWDYILRNLITFFPLVFFNFSLEAIAYAQALSTVGGMLGHGNLKIKNGFWNYLIPTYEVHRWHH